jgi:hypothetical protein
MGEHLLDQMAGAPAIHQDVVIGPDQLVAILARLNQ